MAKEKGLEEKQAAFCREYLKDYNATQAAIRAGYSQRSAQVQSARLLSKVMVQAEISKQVEAILEQSKISLKKQIFDYWMRRAFYDPAEIISTKGGLLCSLKELSEKGRETVKVKLADRDKALEMLQRYIQMIKEQVEFSGELKLVCDGLDLKAIS